MYTVPGVRGVRGNALQGVPFRLPLHPRATWPP